MRKRFGKRIISLLLTFCILLSLLPLSVMAATAETETGSDKPFTDIEEGSWYYDAVMYAYANGLVNGVTPTTFDPQGGMTRGMFVTILGRMAGVDTTAYVGQSTFDDVDVGIYYAPYVAWAVKNGIVNGTGGNKYSPDMLIDRQQLATFFVRYCEAFGVEYGEDTVTTQPADIDEVADWAKDSVLKLWSKGILNGDGTNFNPVDEATRAEAVTLSTRMDNAVETWYSEPGVESDRVRIDPATGEPLKPEKEEAPKFPVIPARPSGGSDDTDNETTTSYLVEFGLVDGLASEIASAVKLPRNETYREGTKIEHLPAPSMQNGLLLGWYYDAAMTKPVPADATVTKSLKLYAKMGTVSPISEEESPRYITVQVGVDDVAAYSFKIKGAFDAADVTFINVSANNQVYTRRTTGALTKYDDSGAPLYEYKAVSDGADGYIITALWEPGQTYSIKLADDSPAVFVAGGATHTTHIRTLNIITGKAETMELSVNDDIRYIAKDHTGLSGMSDSLKGLFTVSLESVTPEGNEGKPESEQGKDIKITPVEDTGTFTFTGLAELSDNKMVALKKGDTVAIYTGERPDKRGLTSDAVAAAADAVDPNGSVAYVEITSVEGDVFTYKTAESEDVLFTPDVLPLLFPDNGAVSLADTSEGGTFTVPVADMTYTDDIYAQMGLDSQTKVEAGDFIMFYLNGSDGTIETASAAGSNPYAKITKVVESDGAYTIDWVPATEAEVMAAMDLYDTRNQAIVQDDKKIEEMENEMVRQAIESGFVDEAAEYLAALALETDGFERMDGDMDLSSYSITFEDGTPVDEETMALMAGNKAEITKKEVAANIMAGPVLQHFEDSTGLRAELGMEFTVEVDLGNDNKIVIQLEAIFEQEVLLTINVSGGAVWKKAWIFPYIADYQMNANLDVGTYTGIGVTATVKTVAPEDEEEEEYKWESVTDTAFENVLGNVGEIIKDTDEAISALNDKVEDLNSKIEELIDKGEHFLDIPTVEVPSVGINGTESVGTVNGAGLAELYSDMMSEATDNWIEIVRVEIFSSEGHVDPLHILCYGIGADFVVSATMHVTIGMTFQFGVAKRYAFSLKLFARESTTETIDLEEANYSFKFYVMGTIGIRAGIEFEVAVGLFSLKLDSIGIAAEVGAYAQMWGYFYYELTWSKSEGKDSRCSGALFIEIGIYLSVSFKAQLFSYDKLTYNPTLYENEWPLWSAGDQENVYDFYYPESPEDISEDDFKDEETEEIDTEAYEEEVAALTELLQPVIEGARSFTLSSDLFNMNYMDMKTGILHGSDFEEEEEEDDDFSFGDLVPGDDGEEEPHENSFPKNYDSNKANNGDADDEKHFIVEVSSEYFSYDPTTNTVTVTAPKGTEQECEITITWKGNALAFSTKPMSRTVTIKWSDPANSKFIAFDSRGGSAVPMITTGAGQDISGHKSVGMIPTKVGYTFEGWYESIDDFGNASKKFQFTTMGDYPEVEGVGAGITLYANWTPNSDTKYKVEHYFEELNGKYVLYADMKPEDRGWTLTDDTTVENKVGTTDALTQAQTKNFTGFVTPSAAELEAAQQSIAPDGSTVVKLYYKRAEYTATFHYGDIGAGMDPVVSKAKYMGTVAIPALALGGYDFKGFTGLTDKSIRLDENKNYTAEWDARTDTPYRAELYVEKTDGSGYVLAADPNAIQHLGGTTGAAVDPASDAIAKLADPTGLTYSGATVNGVAVSESNPTVVTTDGKLVIKLLYNRNQYELKYMDGEEQIGETESVRYGAKLTVHEAPTKDGWTFDGWYTDADFAEGTKVDFSTYTMPDSDVTLYVKWKAGERSYTVNHYVQGVDGQYSIADVDSNQPTTTGEELTLADLVNSDLLEENVITYKEAKVGDDVVTTYVIPATGDVVINLYYQRTQYTLTWVLNDGVAGDAAYTAAGQVYAGAALTAPALTKAGYTYTWSPEVPATMPAENAAYTAVWAAGTDTAYTVKHLQQNADNDEYTEVLAEPKTGTTGELTAAEAKDYSADGFQAGIFTNAAIAADGTTVIEVKYDRVTYEVTFDANDGTLNDDATKTFRHGQTFSVTAPVREDYAFAGWFEGETKFEAAVVTKTMALTAHWTAGAVNYTVNHYVMGTDGTYPAAATSTESGNGIVGSTVTLSTLKKSYYEYENGLGTAYDAAKTEESGATVAVAKNMTVNIYYARKTYALTWNADGGQMSGDYIGGTVYYGAAITAPTVTKTGHTGGWSNVAATMPAQDTTYTAQWTIEQYTITFNTDGGSTIAPITQDYNTDVTEPADPTKTGYNFVKWVDENGADASVPSKMPAGDMTLKAIWEAQTYTIKYNLDGGTAVSLPTTHTYGQTTQIPNPTKTGYTFAGWTVNDGTDKVKDLILGATDYTADITLTANWTVKQYTITFANTGDSTIAPITKDYGSAVDAVADPSKYGYTFAGWDKTIPTTMPAENMTITAAWTAIEYTITYNLNGGAWPGGTTPLTKYTIESESQTFGVPERAEYTFVGWYTDPGFDETAKLTGITKGQTGNITVYAKWVEATYSITYVLDGGTNNAANPATALISNPEVTLKDPSKQYHTFIGWTGGGLNYAKEPDATVKLQGNTTFTANWEKTKYTVTFDVNGGDALANNTTTLTYDASYSNLPTPTKTGHTFAGWWTKASGGTQVEDGTAIATCADHTLYARWTPKQYTITFEENGGTQVNDITMDYSASVTKPTDPTKTGYTFNGWYEKSDFSGNAYTFSTMPENGVTLYAKWTAKTVTVNFDVFGGNTLSTGSKTVTYDSTYGELPTPTRRGYTFDGWYTSKTSGSQVTDTTTVTKASNHTIYARWTAVSCTVIFNLNYDGGSNSSQTVTFDSTYGELPAPTRSGFIFAGWNRTVDGSGSWITETTTVDNTMEHTVYAQWSYGISIGGVPVTDKNCSGVSAGQSTGTISYDSASNTLTLSDVTLAKSCDNGVGLIHVEFKAVDLNTPAGSQALTISLIGTNMLNNTTTGVTNVYGIYSQNDLVFTGSGSLTVTTANATATGYNRAIWLNTQSLYVKGGCTVTATAGTGSSGSYGIYGIKPNGWIKVEQGTLTASGKTKASYDKSEVYTGTGSYTSTSISGTSFTVTA